MMEIGDEMIKLAVIADDLTGANDTALQFAKRNIHASVKMDLVHAVGENRTGAAEVIVADSDSRDLDAAQAYEKVYAICTQMRALHPQSVFKKIDSTLRGNIGAEIRAAADAFAPDLVVIAPAYPRIRRTTVGGHHLMDGIPLDLTEIASAPKTPVHESYIPAILAKQADNPVGVLDYQTVHAGVAAIQAALARLRNEGIRWIVSDVAEEQNFVDLMAALHTEEKILWVGSAGLADYLPAFYGWAGAQEREVLPRTGAVVVCAGSVSHTTQMQVRRLKECAAVAEMHLDVARILSDPLAAEECVHELNDLLHAGQDVLITSAQTDAEVRRAVTAGKRHGLSGKAVSERIAAFFAEVLGRADLHGVAGVVLTGGDTAVHICRALDVHSIDVLREIEPGVPLGVLRGRHAESVFVVTKAGAFGTEDAFVHAVHEIRNI